MSGLDVDFKLISQDAYCSSNSHNVSVGCSNKA